MEGQADSTPDAPESSPEPAAESPPEQTAAPKASRARRIWVRVLLFLAALLTVISIFAVLANRQVLNANHWSDTSTALLQNDAIRTQLSTYLVDQVYANVNVSAQLSSALPPRLQPLAGPISGGLRNLADKAAFEILSRPAVQSAWRAANKLTAQQFINIVEGKSKLVQLNGNAVFVDLRPIIGDLASQIGLPASLTDKIPSDAGRLKVMTSDQISTVQNGVDLLKGIAIVAPIVALLLFALAVYLYTGRRRHTLWIIGIDLAIAGLLVIIVRNFAGHQIVGSLVKDDAVKPAAQATWSIGTALLSDVAQSVVLIGLRGDAGGGAGRPAPPICVVPAGDRPVAARAPGHLLRRHPGAAAAARVVGADSGAEDADPGVDHPRAADPGRGGAAPPDDRGVPRRRARRSVRQRQGPGRALHRLGPGPSPLGLLRDRDRPANRTGHDRGRAG